MFQGTKLQHLRTLHNLSRNELGKKLGISEQAIWQFETGLTEPKFSNVTQLCTLFAVKSNYFYREVELQSQFSQSNLVYRLADNTSLKGVNAEIAYLDSVNYIIRYLESMLIVPETKMVYLRQMIKEIYLSHTVKDATLFDQLAQIVRDQLGIVDNHKLLFQLERAGIHILEKDVVGRADAYSAWSAENIAYIVLSKYKPLVRQNFDLAHELGHLLMHFDIDILDLDKQGYKQLEDEANAFASSFLLPKQEIIEDLNGMNKFSNPDAYKPLKLKYNVSIQALEMRAYKLGYLSPKQHSYFYRQINLKQYKNLEPFDTELSPQRPGKIRYLLDTVLKNELTTLQELEDYFGVKLKFLEQLFSISHKFFEKYLVEATIISWTGNYYQIEKED
ncbi:XRE family transcriptional regulator [Aerococcaceae bacterium zg-ZJ1578]|uniref:spr1629 family repressor/antitoxin n=1 Tax=Aerococcaceae bacterium zg-252 TaxID=2796928 RepID=UPI001A223E15|nr:XRE family transcriptional regulator [Aerococcaceae bacterium zg-1578]